MGPMNDGPTSHRRFEDIFFIGPPIPAAGSEEERARSLAERVELVARRADNVDAWLRHLKKMAGITDSYITGIDEFVTALNVNLALSEADNADFYRIWTLGDNLAAEQETCETLLASVKDETRKVRTYIASRREQVARVRGDIADMKDNQIDLADIVARFPDGGK